MFLARSAGFIRAFGLSATALLTSCERPPRPSGPPPEYVRPSVPAAPVTTAPADPFANLNDAVIHEPPPGAAAGAGGAVSSKKSR